MAEGVDKVLCRYCVNCDIHKKSVTWLEHCSAVKVITIWPMRTLVVSWDPMGAMHYAHDSSAQCIAFR